WRSRLRDRKNIFGHSVGTLKRFTLEALSGEGLMEFVDAFGSDRLRAVDEGTEGRQVVSSAGNRGYSPGHELKCEIGLPRHSALVLTDQLEHGFRPKNPLRRRLHDHREVTNHRQHKTGDQTHIVVQGQPAIQTIGRCDVQGFYEMRE